MSVVGIVSMKGGVGKTSVTANLAAALSDLLGAQRVHAIDLDPQNALQWHFGGAQPQAPGVSQLTHPDPDWAQVTQLSDSGVACTPYGRANESQRHTFETLLLDNPLWLGEQIDQHGLDQNTVVLIDTPPGHSVYLRQVLACADMILIVILTDAGSFATIPSMESVLDELSQTYPDLASAYVLNQFDETDELSNDVALVLSQQLRERMVPVRIHLSETVGEALAFQQPVLSYDPHGQASQDFSRLASWVVTALNP